MMTFVAALLIAVLGFLLGFRKTKAIKAKKVAEKELGTAWVDSVSGEVTKQVIEVRAGVKAEAEEQHHDLAEEVETNSASAVAAASALNDAFSKLKK